MSVVLGALLVGLTLGMLGSGGSAITVPVLIYLVGHGTKQSIAESMAIVGLISAVAAVPYARAQQVDWRSVLYFGLPGMAGTFVGAWLGGLAPEALQLVTFGGVLLAAAVAMLGPPRASESSLESAAKRSQGKIAVEGILVGITTGFVGVGGGFLVVPALVVMGKLPLRLAMGTSLVIIAAKAAVGFFKYEHDLTAQGLHVDLRVIALFVGMGAVGSLLGKWVNARLNQQVLRRSFAIFLIALGAFVMVREGSRLIVPSTSRVSTASHSSVFDSREIVPCY